MNGLYPKFPNDGEPLLNFLESILSKKLEDRKLLNLFERVVDYLCTKFSSDYLVRYEELRDKVSQLTVTEYPDKVIQAAAKEGLYTDLPEGESAESDIEVEECVESMDVEKEYLRAEGLDFNDLREEDEVVTLLGEGFLVNLTDHQVALESVEDQALHQVERFLKMDGEIIRLHGLNHGALIGSEEKIIVDLTQNRAFPFSITTYDQEGRQRIWLVARSDHYYTKIADEQCPLPKEDLRIKSVGEQHALQKKLNGQKPKKMRPR